MKLQTSPCKEHPVALVAGGRVRCLGADHPPDEEAAEFRNGTKRSISGKPTCRIDDERTGQARWPSAITSPVKKGQTPPAASTPPRRRREHPEGDVNHQIRWDLNTNPVSQVGKHTSSGLRHKRHRRRRRRRRGNRRKGRHELEPEVQIRRTPPLFSTELRRRRKQQIRRHRRQIYHPRNSQRHPGAQKQ